MIRYLPLFSLFFLSCSTSNTTEVDMVQNLEVQTTTETQSKPMATTSIYDGNYNIKTLAGDDFDFNTLKGKKLLIVNTASECGYTPQYKQLQELYAELGGEGFLVIGFPANNFGQQEPGSNEEIATFCEKNYGVSFPMMEKISVKGEDMHPIYKWLTTKEMNGVQDAPVKWNFQKYLLDEEGHLIEVLGSGTSPLDEKVVSFAKS
jgi:glutathione peroxidase